MSYLYVTVILFGDEGNLNREEVIGLPSNAKLQAATLIFGINHWQAPLQGISSTVMSIFPIDLTNHRCTNTRPVMRKHPVKLTDIARTLPRKINPKCDYVPEILPLELQFLCSSRKKNEASQ